MNFVDNLYLRKFLSEKFYFNFLSIWKFWICLFFFSKIDVIEKNIEIVLSLLGLWLHKRTGSIRTPIRWTSDFGGHPYKNMGISSKKWRPWLQKFVENFLCAARIRFDFVKHSPRSGKSSALWFMTVRPHQTFFMEGKVTFKWIFWNSSLWGSTELAIMCEFLAKTLTSESRRKFSMRRTHTFWVCKTFS